ncbi:MAG TPA: methyl-accepting chemotaxis protein [Gemmatimonadaceae bacterium]|nr:methyl-accepting chemotaxis protein [Gemmatimonadaceae bacterium]
MKRTRLSIAAKVYALSTAFLLLSALIGGVLLSQGAKERKQFAFAAAQQDLARVTQVTFKKQVQEWKDLLLRGDSKEGFEKYAKSFVETEKLVQTLADSLIRQTSDSAVKSQVQRFATAHQVMGGKYHDAMAAFGETAGKDFKKADALVKGLDRPPTALMDSVVVSVQADLADNAAHVSKVTRWTTIMLGALLLSLIPFIVFFIRRDVKRPLARAVEVLTQVGEGDLTAKLEVTGDDEVGRMGVALNKAVDVMRDSITSIAESARTLGAASEELSAVSTQMGANAEETSTQAGVVSAAAEQVSKNVQTVAASAEEMSASIKEIAANASQAAQVAQSAVHAADTTNATITKLGTSSEEIGAVLKVITSIAEQTNLLALNATIEAARAGEAGKGFAVVANEVKELAKETAKATEDITRKIEAIQADTKGAVTAIGEITTVIRQVNDISGTIASAVEEQAATTSEIGRNVEEAAKGSGEIAGNITGVATAAQSTSGGAQNAQQAARELSAMATELERLVSRFKVGVKQPVSPAASPTRRPKLVKVA